MPLTDMSRQEATRIKTPPLHEDMKGAPRGFFTGGPPAPSEPGSLAATPVNRSRETTPGSWGWWVSTSAYNTPVPKAQRQKAASPVGAKSGAREWWERLPDQLQRRAAPAAPVEAPPAATAGARTPGRAGFAFDVPEHLPNSPLCPANQKHRSGATGMCVYHGRQKSVAT